MDGLFPGGIGPVTNQKIDLAAATAVVTDPGWPAPIAWADGTVGIATKVGASLCTTAAADHPMRIAYEDALRVRATEGRRLGCTDVALRGR